MEIFKLKNRRGHFALVFVLAMFLILSQAAVAQFNEPDPEMGSCTSIQVGRLASADGSVITAHSCDGNYRTWLNIEPRKTYKKGETNKIYKGTLHTETLWGQIGKRLAGEIPQVEETYAWMNVAYPCMNEKQLIIGETTIGGRRDLRNTDGLFLIEELQRLVLERCTTARDAIRLIGKLVKEFGYGDNGECITIADPKEVWHFEIFGAGPFELGAVWAAVRIPDDQVGVSANIPRIGELNLEDPEHYMASENVFLLAEEMGWWNPNDGETFKFWKAYSGRTPFSIREYYILSTLAPSLNLQRDAAELPFSVKPEKKLSVRDVMAYYRETYEGTEWDMSKNLMVTRRDRRGNPIIDEATNEPIIEKSRTANNWMNRSAWAQLINELKPGTIENQRTIAIAGCSYSQVCQARDWLPDEIGAIAWFSFDNPGQSPRIPIFSGVLNLPESFKIGGQKRYRTDSAIWTYRRANRLAMMQWGTHRKVLEKAVMDFENRAFTELPYVEKIALGLYSKNPMKCREYLTQYTHDFAGATANKWKDLGDRFMFSLRGGF